MDGTEMARPHQWLDSNSELKGVVRSCSREDKFEEIRDKTGPDTRHTAPCMSSFGEIILSETHSLEARKQKREVAT